MPEIAVHRATEADFDALTDLWERAAGSSHDFMEADDFTAMRPYIRDLLLPSMDVWLATEDRVPVGFIGARDTHVELLYIEPSHHGRGLGTRLLTLVGEHGPTSVEVYADNAAGLGFYRSQGFVETRRDPTDVAGRPFPMAHLRRD